MSTPYRKDASCIDVESKSPAKKRLAVICEVNVFLGRAHGVVVGIYESVLLDSQQDGFTNEIHV